MLWWVSRFPARAGILHEGQVIHAAAWLAQHQGECIDQPIELTAQRLSCRRIAIPVAAAVAEKRRQRVHEGAKARKKSTLKLETLALCDWALLVTNLPPESFSPDNILRLQRLR